MEDAGEERLIHVVWINGVHPQEFDEGFGGTPGLEQALDLRLDEGPDLGVYGAAGEPLQDGVGEFDAPSL